MQNKNNLSQIIPFILVALFITIFFLLITRIGNTSEIKYVKIGGQSVAVELAITPEEKDKGLSGRESLAPNSGMLFVFDESREHYFWMKDMNFPIDIIWITEDMNVVYIEHNVQPDTYPQNFGVGHNAMYVLETNPHFAELNNIRVGYRAYFID